MIFEGSGGYISIIVEGFLEDVLTYFRGFLGGLLEDLGCQRCPKLMFWEHSWYHFERLVGFRGEY